MDRYPKTEIVELPSLAKLRLRCMHWLLELKQSDKCDLSTLTKPNASETALKNIQMFLNGAFEDLIYGKEDYSISSIAASFDDDLTIDVGLISFFDGDKYWTDNSGSMFYSSYVGADTAWKRHIDNIDGVTESWSSIKATLFQRGHRIGERFFGNGSATSLLISTSQRKKLFSGGFKSLVIATPSDKGLGMQIDTEAATHSLKWALTGVQDFPQLFSMIAKDEHPLGFLQLKLGLPETQGFPLSLDQRFKQYGVHAYGESKWADDLRQAAWILCNLFLEDMMTRVHEVLLHYENRAERIRYFPDSFIKATQLNIPTPRATDVYLNSRWYTSIKELREALAYGRFSPTDLATGTISCFWKDIDGIKELKLDERAKAEDTLYWLHNYREHFVHTLKVFLMGERIISEIFKPRLVFKAARATIKTSFVRLDTDDDAAPGKHEFEFSWMLAATVHDWAYPIEYLSGILATYWSKFFLGDGLAEEYLKKGSGNIILGVHTRQVFADCALGQEALSCFLHVLHSCNLAPSGSVNNLAEAYEQYNTEGRFSYNQDSIRHMMKTSDHGIASALWYLGHMLRCPSSPEQRKDCSRRDKELVSVGKERKLVCIRKKKSGLCASDDNDLSRNFTVAHAVYNHNLAMDKAINVKIDFNQYPLAFLLLLSDVLQDEGRPMSDLFDEDKRRPIGFITTIDTNRLSLTIDLEYHWDHSSGAHKDEAFMVGSEKCKKQHPGTKCFLKTNDTAIAQCNSCPYVERIAGILKKLETVLTGLPVCISAKVGNKTLQGIIK